MLEFNTIQNSRVDQIELIQYLKDLFDSIVFNDIIKRFDIKNVDLLIRLTHFLVSNIGQLVSANSIVKYLKNSRIHILFFNSWKPYFYFT